MVDTPVRRTTEAWNKGSWCALVGVGRVNVFIPLILIVAAALAWESALADERNEIRLRYRTIGVLAGARPQPRSFAVPEEATRAFAVMLFDRRMSDDFRSQLNGRGVRIVEPLSGYAFIVEMPAGRDDQAGLIDSAELGIRWVEELKPRDKVSPRVWDGRWSSHARVEGSPRGRVDVRLFRTASVQARNFAARSLGLDEIRESDALSRYVLRAELTREELRALAELNTVQWIGEMPKPPTNDNDVVRGSDGVDQVSVGPGTAYGLTGSGVKIAQFELSVPDYSHLDLSGKGDVADSNPNSDAEGHATHVVGTLAGSGELSQDGEWQGVAPGVRVFSYTADGYMSEYADVVGRHITMTTNSWGSNHCHAIPLDEPCYAIGSDTYDEYVSGYDAGGEQASWVDVEQNDPELNVVPLTIFASAGNQGVADRHLMGDADEFYDDGESIVNDKNADGEFSSPDPSYRPVQDAYGPLLMDFRADEMFVDNTESGNRGSFDSADDGSIYRDVDRSNTVTDGDERLFDHSDYGGAPSAVQALDPDAQAKTALTHFNAWGNIRIPNAAKNTIMIGAINTQSGLLWEHSSKGPTRDGRIKPDLVAPSSRAREDGVNSTYPVNVYAKRGGTSTATPAAAGVGALLSEWYVSVCSKAGPKPATLKALLIHSAVDITELPPYDAEFVGPDYAYGFGRISAPAAMEIAPYHAEGVVIRKISREGDEVSINPVEYKVTVGAVAGLKVTLVWSDPPWSWETLAPTPEHGLLHNDLDLELISPVNVVYTPWKLDPDNPSLPAVASPGYAEDAVPDTAADHRNTVEQIVVPDAAAGVWTIRVGSDHMLSSSQAFTVVNEFLEASCTPCSLSGGRPDLRLTGPATEVAEGGSSVTGEWLDTAVWNRLAADGGSEHQTPVFGKENALYVGVHNGLENTIEKMGIAEVWVARLSAVPVWPNDFSYVGRIAIPNAGTESVVGPLIWKPENPYPASDFSYYVRLRTPSDGGSNKTERLLDHVSRNGALGWRNVSVLERKEAASFVLANPSAEAVRVSLSLSVPRELVEQRQVHLLVPPTFYDQMPGSDRSGSDFDAAPANPDPDAYRELLLRGENVTLGPVRFAPGQKEVFAIKVSKAPDDHVSVIDLIQRIDGKTAGGIRYLVQPTGGR